MDDATYSSYLALLDRVGDRTTGLGPLLLELGGPDALIGASDQSLAVLPPATQAAVAAARDTWPRSAGDRGVLAASPSGRLRAGHAPGRGAVDHAFSFVPITDPRYPQALRDAPDAPPWLFCRGSWRTLQRPAIAIVGSRRASRAGLHAAEVLGRRLANSGYNICSGLALGIDAAAHRGALEGGETVAVLASGLDRPSPRQHAALAEQICESGCLLSELPYGSRPHRHRFPRRNRIISGLCRATIVVEAALPSGSLHTAASALEQGRDVFVLPWSVFHDQGRGCLRLLRDGATPITDLDELATLFPPVITEKPGNPDCKAHEERAQEIGADERRLLQLIGDSSLGPQELSIGSGYPPARVLSLLAGLELAGHLCRIDGRYRKTPR
jgi:DNA processing protein